MSVMSKYLAHFVMWAFLCAMAAGTSTIGAQTGESQDDGVVSIEAFAVEESTEADSPSTDATDEDATPESDDETESERYVDMGEPISVENLGIAGDQKYIIFRKRIIDLPDKLLRLLIIV